MCGWPLILYLLLGPARTTKRGSASRWNLRVAFRRRAATSGLLFGECFFGGRGDGGDDYGVMDRSADGWMDGWGYIRPPDPPVLIRRGSTQRTRPRPSRTHVPFERQPIVISHIRVHGWLDAVQWGCWMDPLFIASVWGIRESQSINQSKR